MSLDADAHDLAVDSTLLLVEIDCPLREDTCSLSLGYHVRCLVIVQLVKMRVSCMHSNKVKCSVRSKPKCYRQHIKFTCISARKDHGWLEHMKVCTDVYTKQRLTLSLFL